jgi:23S rRNA (pseudouridine1915-N3)-methyltransferase
MVDIPELKNTKALTEDQQKAKEAELILKKITPNDHVILLDENGMEFTSVQFANYINKRSVSSSPIWYLLWAAPTGSTNPFTSAPTIRSLLAA